MPLSAEGDAVDALTNLFVRGLSHRQILGIRICRLLPIGAGRLTACDLRGIDRAEPADLIVRDERTGEAYTRDYMNKLHRRIRDRAKLPADLKFISFRHGGITEIGDSGTRDVRTVSGHTALEVTRIYNKANWEKARRIAERRLEQIAFVTSAKEGSLLSEL